MSFSFGFDFDNPFGDNTTPFGTWTSDENDDFHNRTEYRSRESTSSYHYESSSSSKTETIIDHKFGYGEDLIKKSFDPKLAQKFAGQDYEQLKRQYLENGSLFEDPIFPAESQNIYFSNSSDLDLEWLRPKEISDNPQMFVEGHDRFDIAQGNLGNCWFLAAIGSMTQDHGLLHQIVPKGQSFGEDYCGIFHFRFWQYGTWTDVVIDDRLPTYRGNLIFVHSKERNEFWSALLEKAYAKLNGSYEALKGGQAGEAMEDFTGGLSYSVSLNEGSSRVFQEMKDGLAFKALICAAIEARNASEIEMKMDNGLVAGHAYTISAVQEVTVDGETVQLVRVRNPWGNEREWNGPWSDGSDEWNSLSEELKEEMGLIFAHDGEFWIPISDFMQNFTKVEICMLSPQNSGDVEGVQWQMLVYKGSWQRYLSAGGCRNFPDSFYVNPQYRIEIEDSEHDENNDSTLVIGLMQKGRRQLRKLGGQNLTIGFSIYECSEEAEQSMVGGKLGKDFFLYNRSVARTATFTNAREVVGRFNLPQGKYIVIPSTFEPNEEGDFVLRMFAEKQHACKSLGSEININCTRDKQASQEAKESLQDTFSEVAGENGEITAFILKDNFEKLMDNNEVTFEEASLEACRSMIAFMDTYRIGRINYKQFEQLYYQLIKWKTAFDTHDEDQSGDMTTLELRGLLLKLDLQISNNVLSSVVLRYANQEGRVCFDDVIQICCRITSTYEAFRKFQGRSFTASDFLQTAIYT